jgi:hypothetical protein
MRPAPFLLTFALLAACGNGDEGGSARPTAARPGAPSATPSDTVPPPTFEPRFEAVEIPAEFPSDFPLPPGHVVVEASSRRDESGVFSNVALVVESSVDEQGAWYRQALEQTGWQISAEGRSNGAISIHAMQGESYIDFVVRPHPEDGAEGWVLIEASIWKLEGAGA